MRLQRGNSFDSSLVQSVRTPYTVEVTTDDRGSGFFGLASVETVRFGDILSATVNVGYDSREERLSLGLGGDGLLSETVSLQGEHWLARDGGDGFEADSLDAWCLGLRLKTWGHQFGISPATGGRSGRRLCPPGPPMTRSAWVW